MANYYCEYCGFKAPSIKILTGGQCTKHYKGAFKGMHAPKL